MKKLIISLFLMLLVTSSYAKAEPYIYTPTADIQNFRWLTPISSSTYSQDWNTQYLPIQGGTQYLNNGLLKFNLSSIDFSKEKITEASLKLYLYSSGGTNTTSLFAYYDNNWVSPAINKFAYAGVREINLDKPLGSLTTSNFYNMQAPKEYNIILNKDFLTAGIEKATELLTIALKDTTILDKTTNNNFAMNEFASSEYIVYGKSYSPMLTIYTAPVPEPSSMLLGLMGLGSLVGLKRKRNC